MQYFIVSRIHTFQCRKIIMSTVVVLKSQPTVYHYKQTQDNSDCQKTADIPDYLTKRPKNSEIKYNKKSQHIT